MSKWLLTEAEIQAVVAAYIAEDFSVNSIRLNRGHWEDITPLIAQAQLRKVATHAALSPTDWQQLRKEAGLDETEKGKE